jgi:uncharacterized membrane protein
MATDPYAAPRAHVADAATAAPGIEFIPGGRRVEAGNGWTWIAGGFDLFKRQPGAWIALFIIYVVLSVAVGLVPLVGSVATILLLPVIFAGIAIGARTLDRGGELEVAHLFAGFKESTGPLIAVGAIYFAGCAAIVIVLVVVFGAGIAALFIGAGGKPDVSGAGAAIGILLAVLVALAMSIPLVMALWFAPPLVAFHNLSPVEAMKTSFQGCLKNTFPFLVYGAVAMALGIVATIPLFLGWLALGPVLAASFYTSYRDIFTAD